MNDAAKLRTYLRRRSESTASWPFLPVIFYPSRGAVEFSQFFISGDLRPLCEILLRQDGCSFR